jgi:hypothetical protein
LLGNVFSEWLWGSLSTCGLEIEGRLLELDGDKVLGELLMLLPVIVSRGKNAGNFVKLVVEDVDVLVVVKGLARLGEEDMGDTESVSH